MRTTLNLDNDLIQQAREYTGVKEKTQLLHMGLEALIRQEAARRLASLGGSDPKATAGARRRTLPVRSGA